MEKFQVIEKATKKIMSTHDSMGKADSTIIFYALVECENMVGRKREIERAMKKAKAKYKIVRIEN